jgi:hypothetical protein
MAGRDDFPIRNELHGKSTATRRKAGPAIWNC